MDFSGAPVILYNHFRMDEFNRVHLLMHVHLAAEIRHGTAEGFYGLMFNVRAS